MFQQRRRQRHKDRRLQSQLPRHNGDTLGVVAGGSRDEGAVKPGLVHRADFVGRPTPFIAVDAGEVFTFKQQRTSGIERDGAARRRLLQLIDTVQCRVGFGTQLSPKFVVGKFQRIHGRYLRSRDRETEAPAAFEKP